MRSSCAGCLLALVATVPAQFSVDWSRVSGGGGTSAGGTFSVSGTIGQPAAGAMSGGSFSLQGGYWSGFVAVQTAGAPTLTIRPDGASIVVSWETGDAGFVLEQTASLTTPAWAAVPASPVVNGNQRSVTFTPGGGAVFLRLRK